MPESAKLKTERIDVRASQSAKAYLQGAAKIRHKNVSEFVLEAAMREAENTYTEQTTIFVDEKQWNALQEMLNAPAKFKPGLAALLAGEKIP